MSYDSSAEMFALWEQYNQVRTSGFKKQANQILNTFLECFKKQTVEVRATFVENLCTELLDRFSSSPNDFWLSTNGTDVSGLPIRIQFPLFRDAVLPELLGRFNAGDAKATRWLGQLGQFFYCDKRLWKLTCEELDLPWPETNTSFFFEKSYAINKDQITLQFIVSMYLGSLEYDCHEIPYGLLCEPEEMNRTVAESRDYWRQLDPSELKDKWNEQLIEYERIAFCWDDYITHKFLYDDFYDYMIKNNIKW